MAIGIENTDNVDAPDADYPYGKVRDNPGDGSGTPANTKTLGDFHQFFARILDQAGIVANGLPDNEYSGFQYFEALIALMGGRTKVVEMGPWDMVATALINVPHLIADFTKIRSVTGVIISDAGTGLFPAGLGGGTDLTIPSISATNVTVRRGTGGSFDSSAFNDTGINRGWLLIKYEE